MSRGEESGGREPLPEDGTRRRLPFGVEGLDNNVNGGAPAGSLVLVAGEAGAGAREFIYTSAVMNALGKADAELFDLYYGELASGATLPEELHYVSFTEGPDNLREEMLYTMDRSLVESGIEEITFADLSREYFQLSPVPREWYAGERGGITDIGSSGDRRDVIEALADYLDDNAADNVVYVDSLTDLADIGEEEKLDWQDVLYILQGIRRAIRTWRGLVLVHVSKEALTETHLGALMSAVDGTMLFEWAAGGNERDRTMVVREFRGVLSQLEAEDIVRFETEIHEGGFDISNIRKIR